MNGVDCSNYTVTLDPSIFSAAPGYDPTKYSIVIQLTWSPSAEQYGSFIEDKNGNVIASADTASLGESLSIEVPAGTVLEGAAAGNLCIAESWPGQHMSLRNPPDKGWSWLW